MEGYTIYEELGEKLEELQNKYNELNDQALEIVEERIEEQKQLQAYEKIIDELVQRDVITMYDVEMMLKFA